MSPRFRLLSLLAVLLCSELALAAPPKATLTAALNVQGIPADQTAVIAVTLDVPSGLHAQSSKPLDENLIPFELRLDKGPAQLVSVAYPPGHIEEYASLGKVSVYNGKVTAFVTVKVPADTPAGPLKISGKATYQLCDDTTCFAPVDGQFSIDTTVLAKGSTATPTNDPAFATLDQAKVAAPVSATTTEGPASLLGAIGLALLVGVIFNVMPCVLPVLPLKAIGFYEASEHRRGKTIAFGLFFSLGVIAIFAILATFLLAGKSIIDRNLQWGEIFAYPAFVWPMVVVLLLLGLWLIGAFGVNLPTSVYGLSFRHDTYTGNFMWGGLTAVLSTPCTAPLFPVILGWAASRPLAEGFVALIFVGVGMALPYLILSAFPELARKFPRTGPFAELFKQMMAFLLLGSAAFLIGTRLLGEPNQWWLVWAVAVAAAVFLVVRTRQLIPAPRAIIIASFLALILASSSFVVAKHLAQPSKGFVDFTPQAFEEARKSGDIVLVKFTASWCLNCKYVEQTVFHDDATLEQLQSKRVRLLKADLTSRSAPGWDLLNQLGQTGIPFTAVYPPRGDKPLTLASIYTKESLLETVEKAK